MPTNPDALAKKAEGNKFFKAGAYEDAIAAYTEAIEIDGSDHTFWSNRSACHAGLMQWAEAAEDARQCTRVNPSFIKGYFRLALAQQNLGQLDDALSTLKRGLVLDARNQDLKNKISEVEALKRAAKVEGFITQAQQQRKMGELKEALRAVEGGLRLDPDNRQLNALQDEIRPAFEQQEKIRRSQLSPTERLKEDGDDAYKAAKFEEAITHYTRCLDEMSDRSSQLALKCYANRAACYKQLSNFDGVISDSTSVLEVEPTNIKALVRRAQAFEAIERYRSALQDTRAVLSMGIETVGAANYQLANGMQHRLNRVVQQLKTA